MTPLNKSGKYAAPPASAVYGATYSAG